MTRGAVTDFTILLLSVKTSVCISNQWRLQKVTKVVTAGVQSPRQITAQLLSLWIHLADAVFCGSAGKSLIIKIIWHSKGGGHYDAFSCRWMSAGENSVLLHSLYCILTTSLAIIQCVYPFFFIWMLTCVSMYARVGLVWYFSISCIFAKSLTPRKRLWTVSQPSQVEHEVNAESVCRATCCRTRQLLGRGWEMEGEGERWDPLLTAERVQNTLKHCQIKIVYWLASRARFTQKMALHKCAFADMDVNSEVKAHWK